MGDQALWGRRLGASLILLACATAAWAQGQPPPQGQGGLAARGSPPPSGDAASQVLSPRGTPSGRSAAASRGYHYTEPPPANRTPPPSTR